jgi:hypothetical protein
MKPAGIIALVVLAVVSLSTAESQERATTTNFYYARPSDVTIVVNVVGFVQRPGRYEIASTIDLINLLSLAGGPTPDGTLGDVTITRMFAEKDRVRRQQVQVDLEDGAEVRTEDLVLSPGDVIAVNRSSWSTVRDVFGVVGYVAILTTAITQVILISR